MTPDVSFIVPCYKLAHFLPECLESILKQDYRSFEILVMDDCSPDDTANVVRQFTDPRIRYVRNEANLGHNRNFNRGLELSRGKYVWVISADDYLRQPYTLRKYVAIMEEYPQMGYMFCSGVGVVDGKETEVLAYSRYAKRDRIMSGRRFLRDLVRLNVILSASGMARRECYEKLSRFPEDIPYGEDWYLWCLFALHYDVGFFEEPMVAYRKHASSVTSTFLQDGGERCARSEIEVVWKLWRCAQLTGESEVARWCLEALADRYGKHVGAREHSTPLNLEQFREALCRNDIEGPLRRRMLQRAYAAAGSEHFSYGRGALAGEYYRRALDLGMRNPRAVTKFLLLSCGPLGSVLWKGVNSLKAQGERWATRGGNGRMWIDNFKR